MILRIVAENFTSFKDAVEFNTFPSSKSHSHENHKVTCGHATALRMSAIYGANGAGKSNLLQALNCLSMLVEAESLKEFGFFDSLSFKLDNHSADKPSGLATEFYYNGNVFYYHIEFTPQEVCMEELMLSKKTKDVKLFERNNTDNLYLHPDYVGKGITMQFQKALKRLVRPDMLLLPFLGKYYSKESPLVGDAYTWFVDKLRLVLPDSVNGYIPHMIDTDSDFSELVNTVLPELKTGIDKLIVKKEIIAEEDVRGNGLQKLVKLAKEHPGVPQKTYVNNIAANVVFENGDIYLKTMVAIHKNLDGTDVEIPLLAESDGTRRLIEYMPLLYTVIKTDKVYVVDEIERSIHPILIKDIVRKLSESETAKGQLIFTTHESGLLDQSIFRPDEIWFAQKDTEQATQLYPLSDFNIHNTANIENGYLNGRYGGIPFLSNLKDLHW